MKTIVVGYDGSDPAKRALERAAGLAQAFDSKIVIVCVSEIPMVAAAPGSIPIVEQATNRCEELAEAARLDLMTRGIDARVRNEEGAPGPVIVDVAEEEGADLVVIGTRDSGLLERLVSGSVSQTVAKNAACDVLIVR